ncbi:hypothetical protein MKX01_005964, partial [Papaver californicum]
MKLLLKKQSKITGRVDKDANGRLDVDEDRQIIKYSASANKLSNVNVRAQEYATMITEELHDQNLGYIM